MMPDPVVAKRSLIEDLVLMRTKLLKWSSFYTNVLIFPIIMYHNALRLYHSYYIAEGTREAAV